MNKKEIIEYLKQNMPEFTGDNIERQKRMAMYIYLELGKLKAFDEKYFFANNKTKTKIYSLAQASKNNVEEIAKKKKIICVTLSYLYKEILSEFGISCDVSTPSTSNDHVFPIINFTNGTSIIADLQQDLHYIQTKSRTKNFGKGLEDDKHSINEDEIFSIQKDVGYVNDRTDYMDEKIKQLSEKVKGVEPNELLDIILNDNNINKFFPNLDYIELYKYYRSLIAQIAPQYDGKNINCCNCFRQLQDNEQKEYCMCIYSTYKDKLNIYLSSKKSSRFLPVSLEKLCNLDEEGLSIGALQDEKGAKILKRNIKRFKENKVKER